MLFPEHRKIIKTKIKYDFDFRQSLWRTGWRAQAPVSTLHQYQAHQLKGKCRTKVPGAGSLQSSAELLTVWVTFSPNLSWAMPDRAGEQKCLHAAETEISSTADLKLHRGSCRLTADVRGCRGHCWRYFQDSLSAFKTPSLALMHAHRLHAARQLPQKTNIWELPEEASPAQGYAVHAPPEPIGFIPNCLEASFQVVLELLCISQIKQIRHCSWPFLSCSMDPGVSGAKQGKMRKIPLPPHPQGLNNHSYMVKRVKWDSILKATVLRKCIANREYLGNIIYFCLNKLILSCGGKERNKNTLWFKDY